MRLSILTVSIILSCPLISMAAAPKVAPKESPKSASAASIKHPHPPCLIPGYQAKYKSYIQAGKDGKLTELGVITRTVEQKTSPSYTITSQLKIDKFFFHDTITQTSSGIIKKVDGKLMVVPKIFSLKDTRKSKKQRPPELKLNQKFDKLKVSHDSLSYLLQLRIDKIEGLMVNNFNTQTIKGAASNAISISGTHKPVDFKQEDGKTIKAIKEAYSDDHNATGFIWLKYSPSKNSYPMIKTEITMKNPKDKDTPAATFTETLISYDANEDDYGCLMLDSKKK
jgi:hypothetical protein